MTSKKLTPPPKFCIWNDLQYINAIFLRGQWASTTSTFGPTPLPLSVSMYLMEGPLLHFLLGLPYTPPLSVDVIYGWTPEGVARRSLDQDGRSICTEHEEWKIPQVWLWTKREPGGLGTRRTTKVQSGAGHSSYHDIPGSEWFCYTRRGGNLQVP